MDVNKNLFLNKKIILGKVNTTKDEIKRFKITTDDILLTRTSETKKEIAYASCLLDEIPNCVYSGFLLKASPVKKELTFAPYITLLLHSPIYRNKLMKVSTETSRALINSDNLSRLNLLIPSITEQQKIFILFSSLEIKLSNIESKIIVLKKYKKGLCNYLFINDKNSNIHLYDLVENYPSQMLTKDIEKNVGIYPVYDATGKVFKNIDFYQQTNDSVSIIKYGSGCGRTFVSKGHHSILGTMNDLIPLNKDDVQFLYAYTISSAFRRIVKKYTEIGTTPNLYYSDYSKVTISLKAIENKEKISKLIMNIEEHENLLKNQLTQLKIMKKNLLNLLFI